MSQASTHRTDPLAPSALSAGGFLGSDTRTVERIVADDARMLDAIGIDRAALTRALEDAYLKARGNLGARVDLAPGLHAEFHESMGRISCPLHEDGLFEKGEAVVTDTSSNAHIVITRLALHLIEEHGFFQGAGSRFRIDPVEAARLLRVNQ